MNTETDTNLANILHIYGQRLDVSRLASERVELEIVLWLARNLKNARLALQTVELVKGYPCGGEQVISQMWAHHVAAEGLKEID